MLVLPNVPTPTAALGEMICSSDWLSGSNLRELAGGALGVLIERLGRLGDFLSKLNPYLTSLTWSDSNKFYAELKGIAFALGVIRLYGSFFSGESERSEFTLSVSKLLEAMSISSSILISARRSSSSS